MTTDHATATPDLAAIRLALDPAPASDPIQGALLLSAVQAFPEAPHSYSVSVKAGSLCHQITTRGTDAAETARRHVASIQALQDAYAPPVPSLTAQIAALKAKWLDCAVLAGDMEKAKRIVKGAALAVQEGGVQPTACLNTYAVTSSLPDQGHYYVTRFPNAAPGKDTYGCNCPDYTHTVGAHPAHVCKHIWCVVFWLRATVPA
jgi:hypothetical protein